jgi:hypothetical protein
MAAAIAITAGVGFGIFVSLRWPVRIWRQHRRKRAVAAGVGVVVGLLFLFAASRVVP